MKSSKKEDEKLKKCFLNGCLLCSSCIRFVLICYEKNLIVSVFVDMQAEIVMVFNSSYLESGGPLEISTIFTSKACLIKSIQLNCNETLLLLILDFSLSISNGFVSSQIYYRRDTCN